MQRAAFVAVLAAGLLISGQQALGSSTKKATCHPAQIEPDRNLYLQIAAEVETVLRRDVLDVWFPRAIDENNGGFRSNFSRKWEPTASEGKFSVFQGRMTWIAAQIAMQRPDLRYSFLPVAAHGMKYLSNVMWDRKYGGFFWGLDDTGEVTPRFTDGKHLYGISFCLYGATAAYQATRDPRALELAQRSFQWMEQHAHDSKNGGYFEWLTREGRVVESKAESGKVEEVPAAGFPVGFKSMNTHLHLLESFTQLYGVWRDATLRRRLEELLVITRDRICVEPGAMNLYFTIDWRPIPDHDSYGHDVETATLMLEAADILGHKGDPKTERMAKMLVDHALAYGWDQQYGGLFREGTTIGKAEDLAKEWWVQMESLNALLLMHEKYGSKNDSYFKAFQSQWVFIKDRQIDHEFRGIYNVVERDGTPSDNVKGKIWKECYHEGRALLSVAARLRHLAEAGTR